MNRKEHFQATLTAVINILLFSKSVFKRQLMDIGHRPFEKSGNFSPTEGEGSSQTHFIGVDVCLNFECFSDDNFDFLSDYVDCF